MLKPNKNTITVYEHQKLYYEDEHEGFKETHWKALIKLNDLHKQKYFKIIHGGVQFSAFVGVIQVDNITIEILPKIDKGGFALWRNILIEMLKTCKKLSVNSFGEAEVSRGSLNLLDLYFNIFLDEISSLIRQGLVKEYRKESSNVKALKGKLVFSGNIQKNLIHKERFYTEHQVYDYDHTLHQIINETLLVIERFTYGTALFDKLKRVRLSFPEVERLNVSSTTFDGISFKRQQDKYIKALGISKLILLNYSPNVKSGNERMLAILFDMNRLWEEYVLLSLKMVINESAVYKAVKIEGQARKEFWEGRVVKPDIVIYFKKEIVVIDTKWKQLYEVNPTINDLRQMYVYNKYWGAKKSILLYPKSADSPEELTGKYFKDLGHEVDDNNECEIKFLDIIEGSSLSRYWAKNFLKMIFKNQFDLKEIAEKL